MVIDQKFLKIVESEYSGLRLDYWLKKNYPDSSYFLLCKLIRKGQIRVNGKRSKNITRVFHKDKIKVPELLITQYVEKPGHNFSQSITEEVKGWIISQDKNIIVLNKPSGISVQGGTKVNKNIDLYLEILKFNYKFKPKLVHRIDKDTSGILIVSRTLEYAKYLTSIFKNKNIKKVYLAIVYFEVREKFKIINSSEYIDGKIKNAQTIYKVLDSNVRASLLILRPITGRKHQIRKHMLGIEHPIVGDLKYSLNNKIETKNHFKKFGFNLHAMGISFYDKDNIQKSFIAELPKRIIENLNFFNLRFEKLNKNIFNEF